MRLTLNYKYVKNNKLREGKLHATFSSKAEKEEFLKSGEAKMWSDYYMGGTYR